MKYDLAGFLDVRLVGSCVGAGSANCGPPVGIMDELSGGGDSTTPHKGFQVNEKYKD
jgi:hypothetical protein